MTKNAPRVTGSRRSAGKQSIAVDLSYPTDQAFRTATAGTLQIGDLFTVATRLAAEGQVDQAIALYRTWLAHTESPAAYAVQFNLGAMLASAGDNVGGEAAYRAVIAANPAFTQGYINLGGQLERLGRIDEALEQWRNAVATSDTGTEEGRGFAIMALNSQGRVLEIHKRLREAEEALRQSLAIDPSQSDPLTHWVHLRQKQCEWPVYAPLPGIAKADMLTATSALAMLSVSNDPALQLASARRFVRTKVASIDTHLTGEYGYGHERLRIGYLSSDFCSHAVSILTAELYELHDRSRVEVYGFCWSREDGSALRRRVVGAMDHYIRINLMPDEEAARCIRSHEIDILIDLQGLTSGTRPEILCYRPAPVQVTYLGFPGSTALPAIDYVLADRFVLPESLMPYFTEKPLYMPNSFQINDRKRQIGPKPTRASCKLPEDAFVFCSFNNNYKFSPEVFGSWMRILARVPGSVLWIVADNEDVRRNLHAHAASAHIDSERIIFAERVQPTDYLARYQVADLFLDTAPFNAGTTASDALWVGLPLLTCAGATFSSRMAGSLLLAVDLPELITTTTDEYEDKAVALGLERSAVEAMKRKLVENRDTCALFDSPRFVRDMEDVLRSVAKPAAPACAPADAAPEPGVAVENVMVIIHESDIATALELSADLDSYKTYVFDPGLVDKILKAGLANVEFIPWEDGPGYFELDQSANATAYEIERTLSALALDLLPEVKLLSWQHLHLYYMIKSARWYQGMWRAMTARFENTRPFIFINDNPAQFYWPSFIPALILLETLVDAGISFQGFTGGARNDDMRLLPRLVRDADTPPAEILTHIPTCFDDAPYVNAEMAASGKRFVNITSKHWDVPIHCAHTVPLDFTGNMDQTMAPGLCARIDHFCAQLHTALDSLLMPFIRTAGYRVRQAEQMTARFATQTRIYFMLEDYFGGEHRPAKMILSDHDTDFLGPLVSYATKHDIPVLILPHSKASPDLFYSYRNATSLMHPICGEQMLDAHGRYVPNRDLACHEQIRHTTAAPAPFKRLGLMLNSITASNGILNTHYDLYMDGIVNIVEWSRANGIELVIRCKPSYTITSLLKNETGIDIPSLTEWINITMAQFAARCDLCLMYDAPTSGVLEFLNASVPVLNAVPEELSKVEARVCDARVVPRTSVEKALTLLDAFVADELNLYQFRNTQFQHYVQLYERALPLRAYL